LKALFLGLRSASYPTDQKEQQQFVVQLLQPLIRRVLGRDVAYSVKIWTVEHRRLARGTNEVLIRSYESKVKGGWI